jgi:AraC-like DNA-binding protein
VRTLWYEYEAGHVIASHTHDWHQLVFAAGGVMVVRTEEGLWSVPPHRAVWVPAQVAHDIRMSGAVSMRTLYFPPGLPGLPAFECRVMEVLPLLRELILAAVARGCLRRGVGRDEHLLAVILDEMQALPERPLHVRRPRDPRAARLAGILEADPAQTRSITRLCAGTGGSRKTLERVFKRETGMSIGRWRQQMRLGRALELLAAGTGVTAVALEVGYESPSAFVAAFRNTFGETPGRYFQSKQPPAVAPPPSLPPTRVVKRSLRGPGSP